MKIAVAVCTLNRPQPLSDALESCVIQTRPPDKVILIDDGELSTENFELRKLNIDHSPRVAQTSQLFMPCVHFG